MGAPRWRALRSVSLWLTLGRVPFKAAPLLWALLWVSLSLTSRSVPFETAPLWKASHSESLWLTLGIVPSNTAPLLWALLWVSLWPTLGSVPFVGAPLWWALLWVSLWPTLGSVPFKTAHLCWASHCQSQRNTFWREYSGTVRLQSSPFLQGRAGNDYDYTNIHSQSQNQWVSIQICCDYHRWLVQRYNLQKKYWHCFPR